MPSSGADLKYSTDVFEVIKPGVSQQVNIGAASVASTELAQTTTVVRLFATIDCFVTVDTDPTALTNGTSMFIPRGIVEYFAVRRRPKIAVIAADASQTGKLYITEGAE